MLCGDITIYLDGSWSVSASGDQDEDIVEAMQKLINNYQKDLATGKEVT